MRKKFVTIHTLTEYEGGRYVDLDLSLTSGQVTLLGNLEHGTKLVINQKLLDDLAEMLKDQTEIRKENCACLECGGQLKCYEGCPNPAYYQED